ncbi:RNA polymerase sigma factor [Pelagicoccus albus]|uniref:RNA polymerase sigma factor n=1 Tax=Pelagicoccus albus TaxID=415222 RepID=A0A7X1E8Q0_9BACT|nr:sigma-70 family RNA polymerase sigma factor [Pelagicoccus albus]MBC2606589.1 sigma-70 family RNA polymerase sigma factor [Pelagicoccus albus]
MQNQIKFIPNKEEPGLDKLSDADLVSRCQQDLPDDIEAYRELVERYEGLVYNFCVKTIGSPQDAEEVAQDAFITVFHKLKQFEGKSTFKTWLYKIVHNSCRNRISKLARKRQTQEAYEDHMKGVQNNQSLTNRQKLDNRAHIQEALTLLKEQEKEIITYKFILGMTLQEIADTLNLGESATKMRFYRAMESFKAAYERSGKEKPAPITPKP